MDAELRALCSMLPRMSDDEAREWLLQRAKEEGGRTTYRHLLIGIEHRSWKRRSRKILARYFIENSFPGLIGDALERFSKFMPIGELMQILRDIAPSLDERKLDLLKYYLGSHGFIALLRETDRALVADTRSFLGDISS